MPTTANRGYATPAHGAAVDTWDSDLNTVFNQIDQNLGAVASVALSNAPVTLSASEYVCGTIVFSGTLTANVTVTFPNVGAWRTIRNQTTGNFVVTLKTAGVGAIIGVPPGELCDVCSIPNSMFFRNLIGVGSYLDYAGLTVPAWVSACTIPPFLLCDGSTFSAVTYPALAAILGGTTLPDFRGRGPFYLDGGTNRITTAGSGIDGATRFSVGGSQSHTNTLGEMVSHNHGATGLSASFTAVGQLFVTTATSRNAAGSDYTFNDWAAQVPSVTIGINGNTANAGSGTAYGIMPPAVISGIRMIRAG